MYLNDFFSVKGNTTSGMWVYEKSSEETDLLEFIIHFTSKLSDKKTLLIERDILPTDITFWLLYAYKNECNMEFPPKVMKELSSSSITFCLSCWEQ